MGIIQGFYQLRAYSNTNYMLYYGRSGSPVMRTSGYDVNNYTTWMIWQPLDTDASYVQLVSGTDSNFDGQSVLEEITSNNPYTQAFNIYKLLWNATNIPSVVATTLDTATSASSMGMFVMKKAGTTTYGGATRDVVTFKLPYNGKYLDYSKAISNQNNSPTLESYTGANTQKFILEEITPYYSKLVAPTNFFLQTSTSGTSTKTLDWWTTNALYWRWTDSTNTINAGDKHWYIERDRTQNNSGIWTYGDWTDYKSQTSDDWRTSGNKRWMKTSTTIPSCSNSIKCVGKEISMNTVRFVTALGKTQAFQSPSTTSVIYFAKKPTLTKDGLSWTPEGMKVNFTSDYFGQGSMTLKFSSIMSGSTSILSKTCLASVVKDTTVTIPTEYFKRPPKDGENLTLKIYLDTDVYAPSNNLVSIADTLTYDEGNVDVTPTVTEIDGLRYKVDVPYANTVKVWLSVNGENTLLDGTVSGGHTIYEVIPPFCTDYAIFVSYENSDKTKWGTAYVEMPKINIRAHCFTWSGGSVVIWLNKDEALKESFTFSPQSTTHTLAGRSHDVVTYLSDGEKNYTSVTGDIKGYIVPDIETYGTTKESIEKMVEQGHVLYRAPYGRICNVAVTGADITTDVGITEVSISIVQEDDD